MSLVPAVLAADGPTAASRQAAAELAVQRGEGTWRQIAQEEMQPTLGSRWLVGYALTLCEARVHPERLERLLSLARRMQDQNPQSKQWGNLRWYWRDDGVTDLNAVEFCMHDALLMQVRHRDWLPETPRKELDELTQLGLEGCRRHRVPADYTNIAILNAGNLIVLGERLHRADAAEEGYRRLDAICALTAVLGLHEFCSPTYYGTDLNGLLMIQSYAQRERQRKQADALLRLLWTDIAANWFPAAQRLGGCHSRSYDYLRGLGGLDWHLWVNGWLESESPGSAERCEPWSDQWQPPAELIEMARRQLPRLVRQHWGLLPAECRTQMIYSDVALSCCGAAYGNQDSTLAVDLPGTRDLPRCYFIADGREDPYGKKKIETGAARHAKALHLQPFWTGAQRSCDAIGLVAYRARDVATDDVSRVQSHFVLRRCDEIWLDGKRLRMPSDTQEKPAEIPLVAGASLVLRYGSAAVGLKLPWWTTIGGQPTKPQLVDDGNTWNCLRVTVDHGRRADLTGGSPNDVIAAAALWIRVGSGLSTDEKFIAWRHSFDASKARHDEGDRKILSIAVEGKDGPLSVGIAAPWPWDGGRTRISPEPYQGVLEINSREVGRPLLTAVEPLASLPPYRGPLSCTTVPAGKPVSWDAENGLILPGMTVIADAAAQSGRCVGQPASAIGEASGIVLWSLNVEKASRYWLWARVRSVEANRGKFEIRAVGGDGVVMPPSEWLLRSDGGWHWKRLEIAGRSSSVPLELPKGLCRISLQTRQSGTWIDRLMLTDDPTWKP